MRVGHWTGDSTGCTVIVFEQPAIASGEVRGGAPATREFSLLAPTMKVDRIDAVVISGGSAFGLATADGVVRSLRADDRGYETSGGRVPIVPAMALFDLGPDDFAPPGPEEGRLAYLAATADPAVGSVGAGTGARSGRWRGPGENRQGGLGTATCRHGDVQVDAIAVVNAVGEVHVDDLDAVAAIWAESAPPLENTTLVVVVTNAGLSKLDANLVAQSGHEGLGRALFPAHTSADGDAVIAASVGDLEANVDQVRSLTVLAVERAINNAVA